MSSSIREHVTKYGWVYYRAPLDPAPSRVPADIAPDGRIRVRLYVPAEDGWPAEVLTRYASEDEPQGHWGRLSI